MHKAHKDLEVKVRYSQTVLVEYKWALHDDIKQCMHHIVK